MRNRSSCRGPLSSPAPARQSNWLAPALAACVLSLTACVPRPTGPAPLELEAWVVYFDAERGMAELAEHGRLFDRVSLFAYELDPDGNPVWAPGADRMLVPFRDLANEWGFSPWVTVVNDVRLGADSAIVKDSTLIHRLLADQTLRNAHARRLTERVLADGFAGLHLDYERVPEADSMAFRDFVTELRAELDNRGLELEVVVEPVRGPLPEAGSASVAVMAYDLFGAHSGPGPRSTPVFVEEIAPRGAGDGGGAPVLALAVGGFAWDTAGNAHPVDWSRARRLADAARRRDRDDSGGVPTARLANGSELWFEDAESLLDKWQTGWDAGFRRLAIWRLGGNDAELFRLLLRLRQRSDRR